MGVQCCSKYCKSPEHPQNKSSNITKQKVFEPQVEPISENETSELFSYKTALCKIKFETLHEGKMAEALGTGFFCKIHNKNIPFNKALFTNNHVLNENRINNNQQIKYEYCGKINTIDISKDRIAITNKELDYTCIQILDKDEVDKFFNIDETIFNDKKSLIKKDIFILQYPEGNLRFHCGKILDIQNNIIKHSVPTKGGSSGSPLIKRYNINLIVGIHYGALSTEKEEKSENNEDKSSDDSEYNLATPFDVIIKDMIYYLSQNINIKNIQCKINTINLIYYKENGGWSNIFGFEFVKNNKDNITLIINGEKSELVEKFNLKMGRNNFQMILDNPLKNLKSMFAMVTSLENMEGLKYLNTERVTDFSYMFANCQTLKDITPLKNWNVSKGNNFEGMFLGCTFLSDIKPLENWNVSNIFNFSSMFIFCASLSDINPLHNWNVSNGQNFGFMFKFCNSLSDIRALQNWNVSNARSFKSMFSHCESLSDIQPLQNWNVSNATIFKSMFKNCSSLSDLRPLQNWDVSNGVYYKNMFKGCSFALNMKPISKWKNFFHYYEIMIGK